MARGIRFRADAIDVTALHRELVATGAVEQLGLGGADELLWGDCDLASLAENRLADHDAPPPIVELGSAAVSLSVAVDQRSVELARAEREGERLVLREIDCPSGTDERIRGLAWDAPSTLSLWLALEGWPLVRSTDAWDKFHYSDAGAPEALAYKIAIWEAWDRAHGWQVETPRVPGLAYPTWEELEARWNAEAGKSRGSGG